MNILITGAAGFIGFHLSQLLINQGHTVVGFDNINDYYEVQLKLDRLNELGIKETTATKFDIIHKSDSFENFFFLRGDLKNKNAVQKIFDFLPYDVVCNLAAQAGVRYSLEHPEKYINSNVVGFLNILEACKNTQVKHLIYASSSSVYGNKENTPFKTTDNTDEPVSLYAATKKSNELMAHTYSHLYNLKTSGLRFFTVYGPWGRPDMAYFKFTKAILAHDPIPVYNNGKLERDFTYIDDIVEGISRIVKKGFVQNSENENFALYNLGKGSPVKLMDFIEILERELQKKASLHLLPMQDGDVYRTWADVASFQQNYSYSPNTSFKTGIKNFVNWYLQYHKIG